jgi:drug/metabolite transporter (DMT)-like permease
MAFLILHIVLISGFGLILKHAQNHRCHLNPIGFMNYLTAFLISALSAARARSFGFSKLTFALGLTNGIAYAIGFELVTLGMRLSGIVVTIAVVRLSLVVPVVFAILFWNETPNVWQAAGILLACCALPLFSTKRKLAITPQLSAIEPKKTLDKRSVGTGLGLLVAAMLFINSGVSRLAMKAFNEMCPIDQKPMYLLFLFGATTVAYAGVCIRQKALPTLRESIYGALIGVCNVGGSWMFLKAMDRVEALIAFPVSGSGGVLFTMMVGVLFLGERLERRSSVGVVAAILALIFVNLKGE